MKRFVTQFYLHLIFLLLGVSPAFSQNFPEKSNKLVNDYTGTLSADQQAAFERKLVAFDDSTSTQIAVVIIKSLEGYDVADYAVRLAEKWGIGRDKKNNGALLLVALDDRQVTIQTGYGLEGALPDAIARRIIESQIKPDFKLGDYAAGIDKGTDAIISATKGEYKNESPSNKGKRSKGFPFGWIIPIIILLLVLISRGGGRGGGQIIGRRGSASPFWWFLMGSALGGGGRSSGGGFGGFSGGGGGFGGFGGGSFGGGGASGSW